MSCRFSFISELIACEKCADTVRRHFAVYRDNTDGRPDDYAEFTGGRVFAGYNRGSFDYGDEMLADHVLMHDDLCHDVVFAIAAENGDVQRVGFGPSYGLRAKAITCPTTADDRSAR